MSPQNRSLSIAFVCLAVVGGIAGFAAAGFWPHPGGQPELTTGATVTPSRALPDFSLIDQRGERFGNAELRGHWSLMFFGYTNCPDFCPTTLATLAALEKRLRAEPAMPRPQVVFMAVDAKRDTPAQLARYVPYFDPAFIGITAPDQSTIDALTAKMGVGVVITPKDDGTYTVDHSGAIFVLNPDGRLAAILTGPFTAATLETDFKRLLGDAA